MSYVSYNRIYYTYYCKKSYSQFPETLAYYHLRADIRIANGATHRGVFLGTSVKYFTQYEIPFYLRFCSLGRFVGKEAFIVNWGKKKSVNELVT